MSKLLPLEQMKVGDKDEAKNMLLWVVGTWKHEAPFLILPGWLPPPSSSAGRGPYRSLRAFLPRPWLLCQYPALQADSLRLSNGGPESVVSLFSVSFLNNHAHLHISFWHLDMDLCIQVTSFSRTEEHVKTLSPSCIIAYTLCSTTGLHIIS